METLRKGNLILETPSGDVHLEIKSLDDLGHMGLYCEVTEYGFLGNDYKAFKASAFFEFNVYQLTEFVKEKWVNTYSNL